MAEKAPISVGAPSKRKHVIPEEAKAEIGILGGTGNYDPTMLKDVVPVKVYTPYGATSDFIYVGWVKDRKVAFMARHGKSHVIVNFNMPYRANIWAMKELGVTRIISPYAVGSINPEIIKPYEFAVLDQVVGQPTVGARADLSLADGGEVIYAQFADPVCPELNRVILETAREVLPKVVVHPTPEDEKKRRSFVCFTIAGPRFSTRAESLMYKHLCDSLNMAGVLNMTMYSEAALAREAEICMAAIALITDTDVYGLMPVSAERVVRSVIENVKNVNKLLFEVVPRIPKTRKACKCGTALDVSLM